MQRTTHRDLTPYSAGHSFPDAAIPILLHGLREYVSFPEGDPGRNHVCVAVSDRLARIYGIFDTRAVRLWFTEHQGLVGDVLSADGEAASFPDSPHTSHQPFQGLPLLPGTLLPPRAEGRLPPGVRRPLGWGEEDADARERLIAICPSCEGAFMRSRFLAEDKLESGFGEDGDRREEVGVAGRMAWCRGSQAGARFRPAATESPRAMAAAAPVSSGAAPLAAAWAATLASTDSEYARSMTHTAFRVLMSDAGVALSLINSVLQAAIPGFERLADLEFADPIDWFGQVGTPRLDLLAKAGDGRSVMIHLQTRAEDCMQRWRLRRAALALRALKRKEAKSAAADSSCSAERDICAIQLVNYDSRKAPRELGLGKHFPEGNAAVYVDTFDGIHLVQIELPRLGLTFPVRSDVAFHWNDLDWYYYFLIFADRFTDNEIERYRSLGIAPGVLSGLCLLRLQSWSMNEQDEYQWEIVAVGHTFADLARAWREGAKAARLRGKVLFLIMVFLKTGSLDAEAIADVPERLSMKMARDFWDLSSDPSKTEELYLQFIRALEQNELIRK
jgi:hypothetical protein